MQSKQVTKLCWADVEFKMCSCSSSHVFKVLQNFLLPSPLNCKHSNTLVQFYFSTTFICTENKVQAEYILTLLQLLSLLIYQIVSVTCGFSVEASCGCCPPSRANRLVASLRAQYLIESKLPSVSQQSLKWLLAQHVCPFSLINSYGAKRNVLPCLSCYIQALLSSPRHNECFSEWSKTTEMQRRDFISYYIASTNSNAYISTPKYQTLAE